MSVRLRLTLYWAAITAAILLAAGQLIISSFSRELWGALDRALMEEADTGATALAQSTNQAEAILQHLAEEEDLGPGHRVRLLVGDKAVFDLGAPKTEPPTEPPSDGTGSTMAGKDPRYRWAIVPLSFGGHTGWLQDGVDATPTIHAIERLRRTLLVLLPLVFAMSVAGGYFLSAWALTPINSVATALSEIGPRELRLRLPTSKTNDEASRLVEAINQLLARLEEASVAQQRFISEAAHELRTPLTVLRSGLEVTLAHPRNLEESRLAIEDALHDVEGLCDTAEDLLTLARIEAVEGSRHTIVDIARVIDAAIIKAKALAEAKHQTLTVRADSGLSVRGNSNDLQRLVLNLVNNAIKFTGERGRIEVQVQHDQQSILLSVRDNGPGFEPDEVSRVFDPFYRSSRASSTGSGLGLALCREIVRIHMGEIQIGNRPEGGCEVKVRLPLADALPEPSSRVAQD